jgi:hypothetical protein
VNTVVLSVLGFTALTFVVLAIKVGKEILPRRNDRLDFPTPADRNIFLTTAQGDLKNLNDLLDRSPEVAHFLAELSKRAWFEEEESSENIIPYPTDHVPLTNAPAVAQSNR